MSVSVTVNSLEAWLVMVDSLSGGRLIPRIRKDAARLEAMAPNACSVSYDGGVRREFLLWSSTDEVCAANEAWAAKRGLGSTPLPAAPNRSQRALDDAIGA